MSLDFDGGALQTQHEEDDEYDQEDYAREQEVKAKKSHTPEFVPSSPTRCEKKTMYCPDLPSEGQYMAIYRNLSEGLEEQVHSIQDSLLQLQQLLTDLPHDMLDDSGDQLSNYSDCSIHEDAEQAHEPWEHEVRWNDRLLITNPQSGYEQGQNLYPEQFLYDQGNNHGETHASNWTDQHNADKERCMYEIKEDYSGRQSEDPDVYLSRDGYNVPSHCQQDNVYNFPENFRPYTDDHIQEFNNQQSKVVKITDAPKEHLKQFSASEVANGQTMESHKVTYKPYQNAIQQKVPITQEATRRNEVFEEMQREFLGTDENSVDNMQILQLQVLNKARERQLEELNENMEKSAQQIRYLNHQLAMVKDEKDGLALSLLESQKLYQNGKEREAHLEGQIKALESQIQTFTANEEQLFKQSKVAELAMESMQQQLLELRRSDSLQRAREQHETIVASLKQKYEEQVFSLEQKLDATNSALQEQNELCCNLRENVKQLERMLEENKLEKTEIINRLTRSLEESQKQCANLLQTGSIQETNQLRFQLQQTQSAQLISNNMNKSLQEELTELKEEIALYESAAKLGVLLNDPSGELHVDLTDSYVDLGIKKVNWKKSRFHSTVQNRDLDKELSKDEIILELKAEMERLLGSNKKKRNQISQLQNDLKDCQKTTEELKQLLKAGKTAKEYEPKTSNVENLADTLWSTPLAADNFLKEELLRLRKVNQDLQQEAESYSSCIRELKANEEKLKIANQDLCSQMRQMIQDFDRDKQEAIDRCERTYQQHHEDTKAQLQKDLMEKHAAEKEQLIQAYEETISQLKADMDELNKEMIAVKECYITVCGEKDTLEATLRKKLEQEQQSKEEKFKKQLLEEKEDSLNQLRTELEEKHRNSIITAKSQWLKEKVSIKQQIENEVTLAKAHWEKEQKEIKVQAIQEIETEWQSRLERTLEETKKALAERKDCSIQTDEVTITDETSSKEITRMVEKQKLQLEEALKEKEKVVGDALKELETELERKHHENIASQVETALTKAHARWLQELTELEEYKANLKAEREKWEKEHEISAAKQLSLVLSAAKEKWKKELENTEKSGTRTKELEEKILSLRRELELKKEEIPATVKAELAQARAQWNKEKQEEILQLQKQNERDYRSFLDDHRNKINEVLATAKEDLVKQKNELLSQKEAEFKMCLEQKQREWAARETKRLQEEIHQYEEKSLIELEFLLGEIHEELVKSRNNEHTWQDKCSSTGLQLNHQYKEKLKASLQKALRGTVYTILEQAKQEWREKQEELIFSLKETEHSCMQNGEGETGDKARPSLYDVGHQVEIQRMLRKQPPLQDTEMDNDQKCKKRNLWSHEDFCCEHCCQQLEKKERECQDLKRKLEKVCRHLQLAVREHKAKVEQIRENERVLEALMEENHEMKAKLRDPKTCNTPPRSLSEGAISKPCTSCAGVKGLEEMRSQYIQAVGKIKDDMLRYIHESKERAAEMIKAEVLRERQETARKMRKYYLICLQQLLSDGGKHEGAEKKIMNAASKLATMAKVLETPVRSSPQSKNAHSALLLNSELPTGVEQSKRNNIHQTVPAHMESKSCGESIDQKTSDQVVQKRIPYNLRQQLDAVQAETQSGLHVRVTSDIQNSGSTSKQPADNPRDMSEFCPAEDGGRDRNDYVSNTEKGLTNAASTTALQKAPSCLPVVKFGNTHTPSCINGLSQSRPAHVMFESQTQRPVLKEFKCNQPNGYWEAKSEKTQGFVIQETPVRDEGASAEWNSVTGSLHLDSGDMSSLYPAQKASSNAQAQLMASEQFPRINLFSDADENIGTFCRQFTSCKAKIRSAKSEAILYRNEQLNMNPGHNSYQNSDKSNSDVSRQNSASPCSNIGKGYNQHSRKLILDAKSFQQDSGFDSPFPNVD